MRRALAAAALVVVLGTAIASQVARPAPPAPVAAHTARPAPPAMPDAAAMGSVRALAAIGAGQARTLRSAVAACRSRRAPGRCVLKALERAAAGAKLSGLVLHAVIARLPAGPCLDIASRLAGLVSAVAYLGADGVRGATSPGYTWADARAAARVGGRILRMRAGAWPPRCARRAYALSARAAAGYRPPASSHSRTDV